MLLGFAIVSNLKEINMAYLMGMIMIPRGVKISKELVSRRFGIRMSWVESFLRISGKGKSVSEILNVVSERR